jgi:hypothetical protein
LDTDEQTRADIREFDIFKRLLRLLTSRAGAVQARSAGCLMNCLLNGVPLSCAIPI